MNNDSNIIDKNERSVRENMAELTAPLVLKNEEKRVVYGPVLIPDEPDTDNDVVTAEQIESVAHKFVEDYGNIDLQHTLNNVGRLVESYILPVDLSVDKSTTIPKGSWVMGVRVTDDDSWEAVKNGGLGGFSIMAIQKAAMKSAEKEKESKRVTLADLGSDWIVNAVSLVDEPAVPKAKFLAIKSKDSDINSNIDIKETVSKAVSGSLEHRRKLIREKLHSLFNSADVYPGIYSTMSDSVVFYIYDRQDNRKLFNVNYEIKDNGTVEFTSEPQEVLIEEKVVPVEMNNLLNGQSVKAGQVEDEVEKDGFMAKFIKSLGFGKKEKTEDVKGAEKMKEEDINKIVDEKLNKFEEKLDSKFDEVIKSLKPADDEKDEKDEKSQSEKSKDEDTDSDKGGAEGAEKSKDDESEESYKEKYEHAIKELDKKKNIPFSNRLVGQDNEQAEKSKDEEAPERNAFGYKIK